MSKYTIKIILMLVFLNSCGFNANKGALNLYFDEVPNGTSSLEVLKKYGSSQQMWREGLGNVYSYSYSKPRYSLLSFLPIPVFKSKFDNYEVVLTFDRKGKLVDVRKFHDRVKVKSWLVCESGIADCDIERSSVKDEKWH